MPLTRSQYLAGNAGEGPVLAGKPQGVKEGAGTKIAADGTISVFADTAVGLIKANNPSAYNEYVWPNTDGDALAFLATDGTGGLSWEYPSKSSSVHIGPTAPVSPLLGQLWYKSTEKVVYIFENVSGVNQWTPAHTGLKVIPSNVTAEPAFIAGDGLSEAGGSAPYTIESEVVLSGNIVHFGSVVTITGLAPYQYVPITDAFGSTNGFRFGVSNSHADENGVLVFRPTFHDFPASETSTAYVALYELGFSDAYISASVGITSPLSLLTAGSISGVPRVGQVLSYTAGVATGGTPPYTYEWKWRKGSTSELIQDGGPTLTVPSSLVGDSVYVEITATDARNDKANLSTAVFPAPPSSIEKSPFPLTDILFPEFSNTTASTTWKDAAMTIYGSGCIEFSTDGVTWGQQARVITNGGTVTTRWLDTANCLRKANGESITGCVYSDSYEDCGSLLIDKLPSPFSFSPRTNIPISSTVTSTPITPVGYNVKSYVTYSGQSTATGIEASVDGGTTWTALPVLGFDTVPIEPGQTLTIRMVTGNQVSTDYSAIINIGQGNVVQSASFVATTAAATTFVTLIPFPVTTYQGYDSEPAPSVVWQGGDGNMNLTASGCIEFRVNGASWTQSSTAINTGNTLETRWLSSGSCGGAAHGLTISGTITNGAGKTISGSLTLDRVPANFDFANLLDRAVSTQVTSENKVITGFNADAYISYNSGGTSLTTVQASVNSGAFAAIPALGGTAIVVKPAVPGATQRTLQIRGTTGGSAATDYTLSLNAGNTGSSVHTTNWVARTSAVSKIVSQPSITSPVNGARNLNPNSSAPSGITLLSSDYLALNGAGTHLSTSWEVRKGSTGGATVVAVSEGTGNLTSYFIPLASLDVDSVYYARVRHHSTDAVSSSWSNWSEFATSSAFSLQWVRRFGSAKGADGVPERLIWTGSKFIGVGNGKLVVQSSDGKNWSFGDDVEVPVLYGLAHAAGSTYAIGTDGEIYKTTNNATSWFQVNTVGATIADQYGLAYGNGIFVSVGQSGTIQTSSDNCVTWNLRASGTTVSLNDVIFADGVFYAVGGNLVLSSTNGVTWNTVNIGASPDSRSLKQIAHLNGKFVATRDESIYVETSSNGTSWTRITTSNRNQFVAAGGIWFVTGGSYSNNPARLYSSVDNGVTWTLDFEDISQKHVHAIAYAPELGRWAALTHDFAAYSTN